MRNKALAVLSAFILSATALQAQLATAIAGQARAVRAVLAPDKLDTARLGDAVRLSNEMEQIVNQINALP